ncbi:hypothetical protein FQN54_003380 [Arachnomyces sp. PD_36]|nr:hypothetical protein FQN54_003380 [Arachnomyces sp. PD_36]
MEPANEEALPQGAASEQHTQPPPSSSVTDTLAPATENGPSQSSPRSEANNHTPNNKKQESRPASLSSIVPPYWRHYRGASRASISSTEGPRGNPITLEDHTGDPTCETNRGLWASGVRIDDHVVVEGKSGVGAYVVWNCKIDTLDGGPVVIRMRYSEFDDLRSKLAVAFPHAKNALPPLPPKSIFFKFSPKFLEKRRIGLQYFLNCILLNPEFSGSPVLKGFLVRDGEEEIYDEEISLGNPPEHSVYSSIPFLGSTLLGHDQQDQIVMMVAQPRSSLRFSVRREDLNRSHPPPSSTSDTRSTRTTSNHGTRQQTLDFKPITTSSSSNQGKTTANNPHTQTRQLPDRRAKPQLHQSPLSQQPQSQAPPSLPPTSANNTTQEPPLKKAKLDGSHEPNASPVAKLPLRSRDSPDSRNGNGTIKTAAATRTRTRAASGSLSTPHVEGTTTTTRSSRHTTKTTAPGLPVAVDKDAENQSAPSPGSAGNEATGKGFKEGVTTDENDRRATDKGAKNVEDPAGRRSLRSHDGGSRSKSELAMYFQNYEQMLSLEPKKPEFLTADTTILLIDDLSEPIIPPSPPSSASTRKKRDRTTTNGGPSPQDDANNPLSNLHNAQTIDLPEVKISRRDMKDPLSDEVYFKAHRRIERQEKQLRNIEKERAQYEKVQLDRLLEGLQGHDWLRVMGISGITDSEKKLYEPKREFFIKEVTALLDKFRVWKVEEKRRKMEKDRLLAQEAEEEEEEDEEEEEAGEEEASVEPEQEEDVGVDQESEKSDGRSPDINDVDAWAAHQLHQEATLTSDRKRPKQDHNAEHAQADDPPQPPPQQAFTSFYSKPYLRDAAIGKHRRGRKRTAFGHPVPEMEEREFELPEDILTPEAVRACQRKRRRLTRGIRE